MIGTCGYHDNHGSGPWSVDDNLRQMQVSDDAFIARDFAKFNHRNDTLVYMPGGVVYDMVQHIQDMANTMASFPDLRPHNHPYKIEFGEGNWTVALEDATATNTGPLKGSGGGWMPPTGRGVNYEFATFAHWEDGLLTQEYIWADGVKQSRQLGLLPDPVPNTPTIGLSLNDYSVPLSTNPDQDHVLENKAAHQDSDSAFNAGEIVANSLHYSPSIKVYGVGVNEEVLGLQEYLDIIHQFRSSFTNLTIQNEPYIQAIGSGDWTATVSRLSGTLTSALQVPGYLANSPIPATGKRFDVLHYTIARWQGGNITHLKIMADPLTIFGQITG